MQTLLVTNEPEHWQFLQSFTQVVCADDYLADALYHTNTSIRVVNICRSYHYQTLGYYVSLLAQARGHKAIPLASNIQDGLIDSLSKHLTQAIDDEIQRSLRYIKGDEFIFSLYFGRNMAHSHDKLAKKLHGLFPFPLIRFTFVKNAKNKWNIKKLVPLAAKDIPSHHQEFMQESAETYFSKKRFHKSRKKSWLHDMAILIEPGEENPPSNKKAIELFIEAGESLGLHVDLIDKYKLNSIAEYDALFIRRTTAVDNYTYLFSRRAFEERLVVIDDPESIVKCTNKVYLTELMNSQGVRSPRTVFLSKYDRVMPQLNFPCVLKQPDSAFSKGVSKVSDPESLLISLKSLFKKSDLILAQEYIPTPFDWRIGILDHKPLFACKYYMAKDHWQIYNWDSEQEKDGEFETIALEKVPPGIIKTALKATRAIGDGLYGVDIKSDGKKHYVIEVNDNPNIDYGIEDQVIGEALYMQIMSVFLERIRRKHGYV